MAKVKDPVCGMTVNDQTAPFSATYEGKAYYFCTKHCKETFEKNPKTFII